MLSVIVLFAVIAQVAQPFSDFESLVLFLPTVVAFIITQLLKIVVEINDTWKKVIVCLVGVIASFVATWLGWGIFATMLWWHDIVYGVLAGLVASGLFQLDWAKWILSLIGLSQSKDKAKKG